MAISFIRPFQTQLIASNLFKGTNFHHSGVLDLGLFRTTYGFATVTPQVLDDKNVRRRFRASNYQSTTRVKPFICTMPMRLDDGWNQIQFNLSDFTRRAYGTNYIETLRVQVSGMWGGYHYELYSTINNLSICVSYLFWKETLNHIL